MANRKTISVSLTADQLVMISRAITIAAEDGSLYGAVHKGPKLDEINESIEALQKLIIDAANKVRSNRVP